MLFLVTQSKSPHQMPAITAVRPSKAVFALIVGVGELGSPPFFPADSKVVDVDNGFPSQALALRESHACVFVPTLIEEFYGGVRVSDPDDLWNGFRETTEVHLSITNRVADGFFRCQKPVQESRRHYQSQHQKRGT